MPSYVLAPKPSNAASYIDLPFVSAGLQLV